MPNQKLIDYIKQSRQQRTSDDQIKQSLLSAGWSDADISQALTETVSQKASSGNLKKKWIVLTIVIIFIIGFSALAGFGIYNFSRKAEIGLNNSLLQNNAVVEVAPTPTETPSPTPSALTNEDPDIADFKQSFEMIKKANATKDEALSLQYLSNRSKLTFGSEGWKPAWYSNIELIDAIKVGNNIQATIKNTYENGRIDEQKAIFVKEDGIWKMGLIETLEYLQNQLPSQPTTQASPEKSSAPSPSVSQTNAGTLPDFIITKISFVPDPPIVNDEKTEMQVFVKNIGASSSKSFKVHWEFGDYKSGDYWPSSSLSAGETKKVTINPYEFSTTHYEPGDINVKINIETNNDVKESNVSNNTYTQKVNFVEAEPSAPTPADTEKTSENFPDFIVTGIKFYPDPPKINNDQTEMVVTVKNIGNTSSPKGVGFSWEFGENGSFGDQYQLEPLPAGQTVSVVVKPYRFFNSGRDVTGEVIVKIVLEAPTGVTEGIKSNNTFTKTVNFVE